MKRLSDIIRTLICASVLLVGISRLPAQDQPENGFVNLVNLVPGEKNCMISIGGQVVNPEGLPAADSTGWFIVPAGNLKLSLKVEGFGRASGNFELADMQSSILVVFLEINPKLDKEGKPLPPKIRMRRVEVETAKSGFSLALMSLCASESQFGIGKKNVTIKLFETLEIPNWNGGGFNVTHNQKIIDEIPAEFEKAPFYLFIGNDHMGNYSTALVRAEKQSLPPWMKTKEKQP